MHIYLINLINLTRRPDRLAQMDKALKALGLPYIRIEAVDGADVDFALPETQAMPKAASACYLSHIKAYRAFLETGESHCVIMEDDMALSPRLPQALASAAFYQDQNAIHRLEAPTNQHWNLPTYCKPKAVTTQNGLAIYQLISKSYGTGAFVLSRTVAKNIIRHQSTPEHPIDLRLFHPHLGGHLGFKILQFKPSLAIQKQHLGGEDDSDIGQIGQHPLNWYKNHPMMHNLTANLKTILNIAARLTGFSRIFPFDNN